MNLRAVIAHCYSTNHNYNSDCLQVDLVVMVVVVMATDILKVSSNYRCRFYCTEWRRRGLFHIGSRLVSVLDSVSV